MIKRVAFMLAIAAPVAAQTAVPADAEIRTILVDRVDTQRQSIGIVVGVIEPAGRRVVAYGRLAKDETRPLNGDTIFEIGSISKVFTSLLLADAVQRHDVALTDPISKFLPSKVKVPERGGRAITLQDLSSHVSGLPRLPANMSPKDGSNPYADYSVEDMYKFLSAYELPRDVGAQYEYSNLGGGLLGHVLSLRAGMDYEALVRSRISGPLGMTSTGITLSTEMKSRLAVGHSATLEPVSNWDLPTLAGAGALRSTTNDLLTFLAANLGYVDSPLAPAMAAMRTVRRPTGMPNLDIALAWHVLTANGRDIVWHNGGTGGVVVLSNAGTPAGPDDIGRHLLDSRLPLMAPAAAPRTRTQVAVDPAIYDGYVGRYQLAPTVVMTITRKDRQLFTQLTGQPAFEVFPESPTEYFLKVVDAQLTFEVDGQGKTTAVVLHQNGRNARAIRVE